MNKDKVIKQIRFALETYKMFHQANTDPQRDLELVDVVTPAWEDNIAEGEIELDMLAEHIAEYLRVAQLVLPAASPPVMKEEGR